MSRSGYTDDFVMSEWPSICYRGAVTSAIRGKRGQAFFKEMLEALEALPEKKLIAESLVVEDGSVCALGSVGVKRGIDMSQLDPEDPTQIGQAFGIAESLAREIVYMNDEASAYWNGETPEQRYVRVKDWVVSNIKKEN